jgi:hypothetical protein
LLEAIAEIVSGNHCFGVCSIYLGSELTLIAQCQFLFDTAYYYSLWQCLPAWLDLHHVSNEVSFAK